MIVHAGLIAVRIGGDWRGALIEGPSGSGKSDLALRCLAMGARLVADDRVLLWVCDGRLYGRAPETLAGLLEVRGVGLTRLTPMAFSTVDMTIVCQSDQDAVDRLPDDETAERLGQPLPLRSLWPFEPAAPLKLMSLLERVGQRR